MYNAETMHIIRSGYIIYTPTHTLYFVVLMLLGHCPDHRYYRAPDFDMVVLRVYTKHCTPQLVVPAVEQQWYSSNELPEFEKVWLRRSPVFFVLLLLMHDNK
jgi:hypothetical protein